MVELFLNWYRRHFNNPQVIALLLILLIGGSLFYFFHHVLMPLFIALFLAFLLELPTKLLQRLGCSRLWSVCIIQALFVSIGLIALLVLIPTMWQQSSNLLADIPKMMTRFNEFNSNLPLRYPFLDDIGVIEAISINLRNKLSAMSNSLVEFSLASLFGALTFMIYLIIIPLMVFFLLKDKEKLIAAIERFLPSNRILVNQVWYEMNQQITNYIRGKGAEMIIVGLFTYGLFFTLNINYALLLSVLVAFSVLIPYIGAVLVTIPIILVALSQWGIGPTFWTLTGFYFAIQALDGNVLVPILFSEAVNLHPLMIILSVTIFGGIWGFWGLFFAIPLATLIKAVVAAWPKTDLAKNNAI